MMTNEMTSEMTSDRIARKTLGDLMRELFDAMDTEKFLTMRELMTLTGRVSNGGPQYLKLVSHLVRAGLAERQEFQTGGRPRIGYRKARMTFYNTLRDARFTYWAWEDLPQTVKQQIEERYAGQYEWLSHQDWLYPVTRKETNRLGRGERVLNLSIEEAESKMKAWRMRQADVLLSVSL